MIVSSNVPMFQSFSILLHCSQNTEEKLCYFKLTLRERMLRQNSCDELRETSKFPRSVADVLKIAEINMIQGRPRKRVWKGDGIPPFSVLSGEVLNWSLWRYKTILYTL